jgi:starch-binding outer membrane protein, SusD/RagB family
MMKRIPMAIIAAAATFAAACSTDPVSNLNQVTPGNNAASYQELFEGLLYLTRLDYGTRVTMLSSFSRDAGNFTTTDNRFVLMWLGDGTPISNSTFYGTANIANQFTAIRQAQTLLASLPSAVPAYSASDMAKWKGMIYTIEALAYMNAEVTKDTLGLPVAGPFEANPNIPAPILCSRDAWEYIVALLDSAETQLNNAGTSAGLPVPLPSGFAAAGSQASPSTTLGAFAAFNRALAAKANLELAYAIARSPGGTPPTPTTTGSPDHNALTRADSALHASALYDPAALAPPTPGDFTEQLAVYHNFSGASGDIANAIQAELPTFYILKEAMADIEPNDKRLAKIILSPDGAAGTAYASVASLYTVGMYQSPSSPMPIIRNEELNLLEAQIRLGLGDIPGAVTAINNVRQNVGGLAPVNPTTYTAVRDQILHEERASLIAEPGGDRVSAIRDYGLPAVVDTTWTQTPNPGPDLHTTVEPFPTSDATARNENTSYTCP